MNKEKLGRFIFIFGLFVGFIPGIACVLLGAVVGICWTCLAAGFEVTQTDYFAPIKKPNPKREAREQ